MTHLFIIRPGNCLLASFSVLVGYLSAKEAGSLLPEGFALFFIMAAVFFSTAFGNVLNDIIDKDIDKVNKPKRPLPSGDLKNKDASMIVALTFILSLTFAWYAKGYYLFYTIPALILIVFYDYKLKSLPLIGNLTVALLTGYTIMYGAFLTNNYWYALVPSTLAFLINLNRELIKDIEDKKGDRAEGAKTLPIVLGKKKAELICAILFFVTAVLVLLPFVTGFYNISYLVITFLLVTLPLLFMSFTLYKKGVNTKEAALFSKLLKYMMLAGILAVLVGRADFIF